MGLIQRFNENRTLDSMLREQKVELASEVSEEVVRTRMIKSIKKSDFQSLSAMHGYFPQVEPDYSTIQKAYTKHYDKNDMQSAHKLFEVFAIEPEHPLSEEVLQVSRETFRAIVINKEEKRRPVIKDKYIVTLYLPDPKFDFRRKVSAQEFYNELQIGQTYQITVQILQKVNMLGHKIGNPYMPTSNLLFG